MVMKAREVEGTESTIQEVNWESGGDAKEKVIRGCDFQFEKNGIKVCWKPIFRFLVAFNGQDP